MNYNSETGLSRDKWVEHQRGQYHLSIQQVEFRNTSSLDGSSSAYVLLNQPMKLQLCLYSMSTIHSLWTSMLWTWHKKTLHSTHCIQPPDLAFMRSRKIYCTHEIEMWLRKHPGCRVSHYQINGLMLKACLQAASAETAVNGFRKLVFFLWTNMRSENMISLFRK
jgi:hypothetical protein